jgi:hypothetical protein
MPEEQSIKVMRLRYAGSCWSCSLPLAAGTRASYDRATKRVTCAACDIAVGRAAGDLAASVTDAELPVGATVSDTSVDFDAAGEQEIDHGVPGASARREHDRRKARRESRIRQAHPRLGGVILALSDEPQSTKAWAVGARGEELLGGMLDGLAEQGVLALHDRRIPKTKANIDHIAVAPSGVFVIDAKRYKGRPRLQVDGGLFRARTERMFVGSRDCTKLVGEVHWQTELVHQMLAVHGLTELPILGKLCFVDADWPLIGGTLTIGGVEALWPKALRKQLLVPGPLAAPQIRDLHRNIAAAFPPA